MTTKKFMMAFATVIALLVTSSASHAQLKARAVNNNGPDTPRNAGAGLGFGVGASTAPWEGFMNVFDLVDPMGTPTQGVFVFGNGWGIPDLTAVFDDVAGVLTLGPNTIGDPNEFWYLGGRPGEDPKDPNDNGGPGAQGNKWMEANLFQTQLIGANAGANVTFSGVVISNSLTDHTAIAFIKEFNSDFSVLVAQTDVPLIPGPFSVSQGLSGDATGNFQFGFQVNGENVWVTDVGPFGTVQIESEMVVGPEPMTLGTFCSDFEDLVPDALFTPVGDGWQFFHNQPAGGDYFGFAPQGPQICNLADVSGDPGNTLFQEDGSDDGSNQYLNVYSDYDNPLRQTPPTFDFVNNVFLEQTFTGADALLGQTYTFSFDYAGGGGVGEFAPFGVAENENSTAAAFVRVFDGDFNELTSAEFDTSSAPTTPVGPSPTIVWEHGKVSITMDPAWTEGGVVQFGFTTTSSEFEPTGVYYDNICFAVLGDANDDGAFNNNDIAAFVLALTNLSLYQTTYPDVDVNGVLDMNCDGIFLNDDIAAFVAALTGG